MNDAAPSSGGLFVLVAAFMLVVLMGKQCIAALHTLKFGQNISMDAPSAHAKKQGTPTMGGLLMAAAVPVVLLTYCALRQPTHLPSAPLTAVLLVFLAHAGIGFADDFLNIKRGKNLGLRAREKLILQFLVAGLFIGWLALTARPNYTTVLRFGTSLYWDIGPCYYLLVALWMVGLSNATNLTDGLDGLAGSLSVLTSIGLALTVFTIPSDLPLFAYALAGACLGFLWYNAHPAKVFMGDTGSLALGSSFAAMAVVGKQELLVLVFMLVFLAEMVSVMIQVAVFKATGGKPNGRRFFRRAPLHHHFEELKWPETLVVGRFVIAGSLALALGLLLFRSGG